MSKVFPPTAATPATMLTDAAVRAVATGQPSAAVLVNPPETIIRLAAGAVISGVVVGRDAKGLTLVETGDGTLRLATRASLPAGGAVALRLEQGTPQGRAATLTLTAEPRPAGGPQPTAGEGQATARQATPAGAGGSQGTAAAEAARPAAVLGGGRPIVATVTGGPTAQSAAPGAASTAPPALGGGPAKPVPPILQPLLANPAQPALAAGSRLTVHLLALEPPAAQAGATPASPGAGPAAGGAAPAAASGPTGPLPATLPAIVLGSNQAGQPVLQTALGELTLAVRTELAPGSRATLEVLTAARADAPQAASPQDARAASLGLARDWPALRQAVEEIRQADPAAAGRLLETTLPRSGPQLAGAFLFNLAAMRLGDPKSWLGEAASRALQARNPELAGRLAHDFGSLARLSAEVPAGEWRAFFLPFFDGQALQQIRVFSRRQQRGGQSHDQEDAATRFIVELELSQLGPLQLDGLSHEGRFDLMVRSRGPLPPEVRRDIAAIFAGVRDSTELKGDLGFQAGPRFPIAPLEELAGEAVGVLA